MDGVATGAGADQRTAQMASLSFPAMVWAFVPGMMLAQAMALRPQWIGRLAAPRWAAAGAILCLIGWFGRESAATELALVMGVALVIPWLVRPRTGPAHRVLRHAATFGVVISYPFYLWHVAVLDATGRAGSTGPLAFAVIFGVTTFIGYLSFRLIESPAIELSRRIPAWRMPWVRSARRMGRSARAAHAGVAHVPDTFRLDGATDRG